MLDLWLYPKSLSPGRCRCALFAIIGSLKMNEIPLFIASKGKIILRFGPKFENTPVLSLQS
jgi:hypothetical protein